MKKIIWYPWDRPARQVYDIEALLKKIKVLIVEEYEGIVQIFRHLLRNAPEIEVIWEARSNLEAFMALEVFKPDIILITPTSPWRQGAKVWKEFKNQAPGSKLLALMLPDNSNQVNQAKALGMTFLAKEEMVRSLVPTIRQLINPKVQKYTHS